MDKLSSTKVLSKVRVPLKVVLYVIRKKPPKKRTRDKNHVQKCTREHPRAKHYSSARDARLRAKLCMMTVLRHAHNPMLAFFRISRASRRKRRSCPKSRFAKIAYPTRGREHEREKRQHRRFGVVAWNEMVQKKNRRDLIRGRSSVSRAGARAYTFVRVFSYEHVLLLVFFELRRGLHCTVHVQLQYLNRIFPEV